MFGAVRILLSLWATYHDVWIDDFSTRRGRGERAHRPRYHVFLPSPRLPCLFYPGPLLHTWGLIHIT